MGGRGVGRVPTIPRAHLLADSLGEAMMGTAPLNSDNIFSEI